MERRIAGASSSVPPKPPGCGDCCSPRRCWWSADPASRKGPRARRTSSTGGRPGLGRLRPDPAVDRPHRRPRVEPRVRRRSDLPVRGRRHPLRTVSGHPAWRTWHACGWRGQLGGQGAPPRGPARHERGPLPVRARSPRRRDLDRAPRLAVDGPRWCSEDGHRPARAGPGAGRRGRRDGAADRQRPARADRTGHQRGGGAGRATSRGDEGEPGRHRHDDRGCPPGCRRRPAIRHGPVAATRGVDRAHLGPDGQGSRLGRPRPHHGGLAAGCRPDPAHGDAHRAARRSAQQDRVRGARGDHVRRTADDERGPHLRRLRGCARRDAGDVRSRQAVRLPVHRVRRWATCSGRVGSSIDRRCSSGARPSWRTAVSPSRPAVAPTCSAHRRPVPRPVPSRARRPPSGWRCA